MKHLRLLAIVLGLLLLGPVAGCNKQTSSKPSPTPADTVAPVLSTERILETLGNTPHGYSLYLVKVGQSASVKKRTFLQGTDKSERIPLAFTFYVIRGEGKTILVDTGFTDKKMIEKWHVEGHRSPVDALKLLGIDPEDVTDIIVTHRHWDHIGGVPLFPNAKIFIPRSEFQSAVKGYQKSNPDLADALEQSADSHRVQFTKIVDSPLPGIVVVREGKHTGSFQYVVVRNKEHLWVLPSDVCPLYENLHGPTSSGLTKDAKASRKALSRMLKLAQGHGDRVVPSHDPVAFDRFPQAADGIAIITDRPKPTT